MGIYIYILSMVVTGTRSDVATLSHEVTRGYGRRSMRGLWLLFILHAFCRFSHER